MRRKQKNMGSKGRWVSASHWLHHRRQAVQSAVSGEKIGERVSSRKVAISRMAKRMWGEKHENEKRFNLKKETERRILILNLEVLLLESTSPTGCQVNSALPFVALDQVLSLANKLMGLDLKPISLYPCQAES